MQEAAKMADQFLGELAAGTKPPSPAPTMGALKKCSYTHDAMIELIIEGGKRPGGISQKEIAAHFGYTEAWISNILASDAFQARLALRREEVIDPVLRASIKERFEALVIQSLKVLQEKLNQSSVSDNVAIRAAELGAKALGVGGHAPQKPPESSQDRLTRLAARLVTLQSNVREGKTVNGQVLEVTVEEQQTASGK